MKEKTRAELLDEVRSLREKLDELQHVYRETAVGLCYLDRDLRYVQINSWLAAINGLSVEEHLGRTIREVLPEIAAAGAEAQLRGVLETGEPVINGTVYAETAAHPGSKRLYQHSYFANRTTDGMILGVSCIVEDITEHKKFEDPRATFAREIVRAQEAERRSVAQELHDGIAQQIAAVSMMSSGVRLGLASLRKVVPGAALATLDRLQGLSEKLAADLGRTVAETRRVAYGLHPIEIEDHGLQSALQDYVNRIQSVTPHTRLSLVSRGKPLGDSLDRAIAITAYRVVQEAVANALRHANPERVNIDLATDGDHLFMSISDDGNGIKQERKSSHGIGLQSMRERARLVGGTLQIMPTIPQGTTIVLRVPLQESTDSKPD